MVGLERAPVAVVVVVVVTVVAVVTVVVLGVTDEEEVVVGLERALVAVGWWEK